MDKNQPLVSVIVPTKNSSKFLEACLLSIKNQTYKNIEIIVVDNNSTDNTKEIAKKYTDKVYNQGPERSPQRNFGVKQAQGEYVAIIDSDMELSLPVLEECVAEISKSGIEGVVIPEESFGEGFWAQCKRLERSFYVGVPWMEAARFFKKSTYENVGGYNEAMVSGEDWDLSQRVGEHGDIARVASFIRHNEGHLQLLSTLKKKYYYAQKFAGYLQTAQSDNKQLQTNIFGRYWLFLSQPVKLFQNPILGIAMLFMKTCEFGVGILGLLYKTKKFQYSLLSKVNFYVNYFFVKIFILPFEVVSPKWKLYINELFYSFGKIFTFIPKEKLPFQIAEISTKFGVFSVRPNTLDQICASPAFERLDMVFLLKLIDGLILKDKRILFLDVGADFGTYSISVGNKYKNYNNLQIVAFEPTQSSYNKLLENIRRNDLKNIQVYNFALYNLEKEIILNFNTASPGSTGLSSGPHNSQGLVQEKVLAKKLDNLLAPLSDIKYDAVIFKIDTEGAETEVLEGAQAFIRVQKKTYVMVEDFVNPKIVEYLESSSGKFIAKLTPYNSWWVL